MSARGWAACAAAVVMMLSGCDQQAEPAVVTVTKTVAPPRQADQEPLLDERTCEQIRVMRDTNRKLAQDGYAEDYTAQFDRQLRAGGCSP